MAFGLLTFDIKLNNESLKRQNDMNEMESLFLVIEKNCRYFDADKKDKVKVTDIKVEPGKLIIESRTSGYFNRRKVLVLEDGELRLEYYDSGDYNACRTANVLAGNIDSFEVRKKEKVIYLKITKNGEVYSKLI